MMSFFLPKCTSGELITILYLSEIFILEICLMFVEPGLRGSQVMSGDWRRLHQVSGVYGGSPENNWVTRLSHKAEAEDRAWLSGQNRSDQVWEPVWGRRAPEASRRRTRFGIARLASRLREVRSPGIRPMVLQRQIPKAPLVGVYLSLGLRGILYFRLPPYNPRRERMAANSWNPSSFGFPIFSAYFS
jgi:hypothetical protein